MIELDIRDYITVFKCDSTGKGTPCTILKGVSYSLNDFLHNGKFEVKKMWFNPHSDSFYVSYAPIEGKETNDYRLC